MSDVFQRSLREIAADNGRPQRVIWIVAVFIIAAWMSWFFGSRVPVYATSESARFETIASIHSLDSPVEGQVTAVRAVLGQSVRQGDVIVELDADPELSLQREETLRGASAEKSVRRLREEIDLQSAALRRAADADSAATKEQMAKSREANESARAAAAELRRAESLFANGLLPPSERDRIRSEAARRQAIAESEGASVLRLVSERERDRVLREAAIQQLRSKLAVAEGEASMSTVAAVRLTADIHRRVIRAPVSGVVAEGIPVRAGSLVRAGQRLSSIIPNGELMIVAQFRPGEAFGRIRGGQRVRTRVATANWIDYGAIAGRVQRIAGESTDDLVRVEIAVAPRRNDPPLHHGTPAAVDVEVERLSPADLVFRSVGKRLRMSGSGNPHG